MLRTMAVVQSSGRGRAGLGEVGLMASDDSGLPCAGVRRQAQGTTAAEVCGCVQGVRTVVAQAAAQAQGTEGALGRGDSGSREAGRELWCRANSRHDSEVV